MRSIPTIVNLALTTKATEYSTVIPDFSRKMIVRSRLSDDLRIAFVAGGTVSDYFTVPGGGAYAFDMGVLFTETLYIKNQGADADVAEILFFS